MSGAGAYADYTLGDVFRQLWQARWFMILGAVLGMVCAFFFLAVAPPHYRASMIVGAGYSMQATQVTSPSPGDQVSMLRLLMSSVGVENSSDFMKFQNVLTEPSVAAAMLEDPNVLKALVGDKGIGFGGSGAGESQWNPAKLAEYLRQRVRVENVDSAGSLRRITYYHGNAADAAYMLKALHRSADKMIRENIREGADLRVAYLQDAVEKVPNPDHKRALTALLLEQERLRMLVSLDQPFAASIVEPAGVSSKPVWPDKKLVMTGFVFCGIFLGLLLFGARRA